MCFRDPCQRPDVFSIDVDCGGKLRHLFSQSGHPLFARVAKRLKVSAHQLRDSSSTLQGVHQCSCLHVQILHIQRIILNKLAPVLDVLTHQRRENLLALHRVLQLYL